MYVNMSTKAEVYAFWSHIRPEDSEMEDQWSLSAP